MSVCGGSTVRLLAVLWTMHLLDCAAAEKEISVQTIIHLSCVAHWDISMSSMQNVAYKWTHEHALKNWEYKEIDSQTRVHLLLHNAPLYRSEEALCVEIEYDTVVRVPSVFASYVPSRALQTSVWKKVCAKSQELVEVVNFSNVILIGGFSLQLQATIDNDKRQTVMSSTCDIIVPWFAQPLKQMIFSHIKDSMLEYMHLLADTLCQ